MMRKEIRQFCGMFLTKQSDTEYSPTPLRRDHCQATSGHVMLTGKPAVLGVVSKNEMFVMSIKFAKGYA